MEAVVKHRTALNLVHRLTTAATTTALSTALSEIRLLSKRDPDIRSPLADSGIVPVLTHFLLQQQPQSDDDASDPEADLLFIQENALATLLNLSISSPESLMSAAPSLIPSLSLALRGGGARHVLAQHAAATLYCLLSVDAYRPIIGSKHDQIVAPLISLIRSQTSPTRTLKDALKALFALALYPLNRPPLVQLGAVPALFSLVGRDGRAGMVEDASAVIAQVAGCYESVEAFRAVGGVRVLAGMADDEGVSERARGNAAAGLLNLAMSGGERAVGDIMEVEAVEEAMRGLAKTGSARARGKAEELLRVLGRRRSSSSWDRLHLHFDCDQASDHSQSLPASSSSSIDTSSF